MGEENKGGLNIGDLGGMGKGVEKLADLIRDFFGAIASPFFVRLNADAKAYEMRKLAAATADSIKMMAEVNKTAAPGTGGITMTESGYEIKSLPANENDRLLNTNSTNAPNNLSDRAQARLKYQEAKRQQNIESVTSIAAEQLSSDNEVSSSPVDPDWSARLFGYIGDISNEEMQMIWGKILADEIKKPGSYSFRTLEVVKSLNKQEAELINGYARRAFKISNGSYAFITLDNKIDIPILDLTKLRDAGILSSTEILTLDYHINENTPRKVYFLNFDALIEVELNNKSDADIFNYTLFTSVGVEILKLINPTSDIGYITDVAKTLIDHNLNAKAGRIIERDQHGNPKTFNEIKIL